MQFIYRFHVPFETYTLKLRCQNVQSCFDLLIHKEFMGNFKVNIKNAANGNFSFFDYYTQNIPQHKTLKHVNKTQ